MRLQGKGRSAGAGGGATVGGVTLTEIDTTTETTARASHADRVSAADWTLAEAALDADGFAVLPGILRASECRALVSLYDHDAHFRSRVVMGRHGYGSGEYRYFGYPLPDAVAELRTALYARLAPIANRWNEHMGIEVAYPAEHQHWLEQCHDAGQTRPTPLLLRYGPGDYNRLHQDLYGELVFPLQVAILLTQPGEDFDGGELVLTEQRPRMQSRPMVVPLRRGDAVAFAVRQRPERGARGFHRVTMRHGVSRLHCGSRYTLGIIFHDAT